MAQFGKAARRLAVQQADLKRAHPGYMRALMERLSEGPYRGIDAAEMLQKWVREDWNRLPAKERSKLPPTGKPSPSRAQRQRAERYAAPPPPAEDA